MRSPARPQPYPEPETLASARRGRRHLEAIRWAAFGIAVAGARANRRTRDGAPATPAELIACRERLEAEAPGAANGFRVERDRRLAANLRQLEREQEARQARQCAKSAQAFLW
jgi:hypothetical protein